MNDQAKALWWREQELIHVARGDVGASPRLAERARSEWQRLLDEEEWPYGKVGEPTREPVGPPPLTPEQLEKRRADLARLKTMLRTGVRRESSFEEKQFRAASAARRYAERRMEKE